MILPTARPPIRDLATLPRVPNDFSSITAGAPTIVGPTWYHHPNCFWIASWSSSRSQSAERRTWYPAARVESYRRLSFQPVEIVDASMILSDSAVMLEIAGSGKFRTLTNKGEDVAAAFLLLT